MDELQEQQNSEFQESEDFAQLFEESENQKDAVAGIVLGRVVAVEADACLLDIGHKSEERVMLHELPAGFTPEAGMTLPVMRAGRQPGGGTLWSVRRAVRRLQWESLREQFQKGARVEGRVLRVRGSGLLVGLRAVPNGETQQRYKAVPPHLWTQSSYPADMPSDEIDLENPNPLKRWVGRTVTVRIMEIKPGEPVRVSRKAVSQEIREEMKKQAFQKLKPGDTLDARVKKVEEQMVRLDAQGVDCVLTQQEASWYPKANLMRQYRPGMPVKVQVIKADPEQGIFYVSRRPLLSHPADEMAKQFKPGAVVEGEISRVLPKGGFFVRLPGLKRDAYVPAREAYMEGAVQEGIKIKATVMKVDRESIRVVLSQRRYEKAQDSKIIAKYTSKETPYSLGDILNPVEGEERDEPQ